MMKEKKAMTRRKFLKSVAGAAVAAAASSALPLERVLGANDRIHIGVIGCGGRGTDLLRRLVEMSKKGVENIEVIAVCDVWDKRKENAKNVTEGKAQAFQDYRRLLDLKEVDAVWIATPDHWHAKMAIDAMEAGKDIYVEKPMTLYWHEAKKVYQTAMRTKKVVQVGTQGCSDKVWVKANELIKQGKIGKVVWSQTSMCRNSKEGEWNWPIEPEANPSNLDWDMWLGWEFGLAPKRPWSPERYFRFRKYWDYSGGTATDLFSHALHDLMLALGAEFPRRVVAGGGNWVFKDEGHKEPREVPDTFHMIADYPSEHSVVVLSSMANEQGIPVIIRGHEATLYVGNPIIIRPERVYAEGREEERVPVEGVEDIDGAHLKNFLECVRTRQRPNCHVELGYKVTVALALSVLSYREKKVKIFDPEKEEVVA